MSLNRFKTKEPWLYVSITAPTTQEVDSYYKKTGEIKVSDSSPDAPRVFKNATILHTFDEENYPVDSEWMMGEVPGMKINYFGDKYVAIQSKDLYAKVENISKNYLINAGWEQDDDLYWNKDGHQYNYIDEILWIKDKKEAIHYVDTKTELEKQIALHNK